MYELFTDRARKIMQLANDEALHFGQQCVGTEHILLGLVGEGSGVAAAVLRRLHVDFREVRQEVEKLAMAAPGITGGKAPLTPRPRESSSTPWPLPANGTTIT